MAKYIQPSTILGQAYQMNGYSHAVVLPPNARLVIASGLPGFCEKKMGIVTASPRDQIIACFDNCDVALKAAGVTDGLQSAHKVHVFMTDVKDEPTVMAVWKEKYPDHRPTWMGLGVSALCAPGMIIEIQVEAHVVPGSEGKL
ncbi:endoribonuclease L-PSP family protein [Talaromyces stipitatus ATCC 10500]|uniref:Endoribonuclease L-PSP family protein n=1 Tax=Talaromyces stipitatus (strain ATCC 10500 / CBS 375.48 / QM 6759 / NRRL 1006) TaxID=441959 RepID=B8MDX3_TALSN|nr:endoribonuclease L-PSP family protein [Talaromyces stipitatus ATCC 10500]EED16050.1 endoribonuclease L-PSP family protein [Talaromyces stipitatus ATCC 10500]